MSPGASIRNLLAPSLQACSNYLNETLGYQYCRLMVVWDPFMSLWAHNSNLMKKAFCSTVVSQWSYEVMISHMSRRLSGYLQYCTLIIICKNNAYLLQDLDYGLINYLWNCPKIAHPKSILCVIMRKQRSNKVHTQVLLHKIQNSNK